MPLNRVRLAVGLLLALVSASGAALAREVRFAAPVIAGVRANVVVVDLTSPRIDVRPVVAGKPPFYMRTRYRKFTDLVKVTRCLAAINGTFFDPRTAHTLGSMAYEGELVHEGWVGNAVAVDRFNRAHYIRLTDNRGADVDWSQYRFAVAAGPTLINEGRIVVSRHGEGFRDPHLFVPARRSAIGFRANGEMLLVTVPKPVSLTRLARMMHVLGARIAINLDGGSSTSMYYKGRMLVRPKGRLTNILAVLSRGETPRPTDERGDETPRDGQDEHAPPAADASASTVLPATGASAGDVPGPRPSPEGPGDE